MRMRRLMLAVLVVLVHAAPTAQNAQTPAAPPDGIARLLLNLERAIGNGRPEEFRSLGTSTLRQAVLTRLQETASGGPGSRAIVRERMRRPTGFGYDVVADILVSKADQGRVATWLLEVIPDPAVPDRFRIGDLRELAGFDGLLKLRLDTTRQFTFKDLVIKAPDMAVTMRSGSAFVAEGRNGVTGLVLRGRGEVHFSPPDPAEQLQLRIFSHRSEFRIDTDTVFVRVNPNQFADHIAGNLIPTAVIPGDVLRAQQVFDEYAPKTYTLDLRVLTTERWSIEPSGGSLVIEFRTSRHGWLTYTRSPGDVEDISLFDRAGAHNICQYSSAASLAGRRAGFDGSTYDVEHYALDLAFDPARFWITGRASMRVRMTDTVPALTMKLEQTLGVASVTSPQLGELLAIRIVGQNNVLVGLPQPVTRGTELTLEVAYSGRLPPQSLDREAIQVQGLARIPPEEERLIITPEPRYMYSNRVQWHPQGIVSDFATAEMRFTVPAEYQVVASGRLTDSSVTAGSPASGSSPAAAGSSSMRTSTFLADRPIRYIACLISRLQPLDRSAIDVPAVAHASGGGANAPAAATVTIDVLSTQRMFTRNKQTPERVRTMLQFYAKTIGEAPYPNLTLAALDDNLPGGHSPAYLVALHQALPTTPYSWAADPVAFDNQYPPFFLAHEIAHQWWGQAVGWKNYHEQWLSEGLAQYFAVLFAAEDRGPALLTSLISTMRDTSQPVLGLGPISLGYRIGHIKNDGRAFRSIMYNKAAVVLHMLRRFVGDEAFFGGLRRFYTDWRFRKAGTDDFRAAMEAGTPLKLDRFFDQWIRGFGVPKIRLTWNMQDDGQTGVIRVDQSGATFDFPLNVVLQFQDGRSEERTLRIVGQGFEERIPLTSPLRRVNIRDSLSFYETQ